MCVSHHEAEALLCAEAHGTCMPRLGALLGHRALSLRGSDSQVEAVAEMHSAARRVANGVVLVVEGERCRRRVAARLHVHASEPPSRKEQDGLNKGLSQVSLFFAP